MRTEEGAETPEKVTIGVDGNTPSATSGHIECQTFGRAGTAKYVGVSVRTLDRMVASGQIHPGMRETKRPRWSREYLDQWLREQFQLLVAGDAVSVRRAIARRLPNWAAPWASL